MSVSCCVEELLNCRRKSCRTESLVCCRTESLACSPHCKILGQIGVREIWPLTSLPAHPRMSFWPLFPGRDYNLDYLEFRLWIGLWVAFFGLILVATEASYLVQYFTRFTEEGFCALISFIFIYDAVKKMLSLADHFPINWDYKISDVPLYSCTCRGPEKGRIKWPVPSWWVDWNHCSSSGMLLHAVGFL